MEPKPKERIVFDEDYYYGDEGEKMAINDLMERYLPRRALRSRWLPDL